MGFTPGEDPKPPGLGESGFFDPEAPGRPYSIELKRELGRDGREYFRLQRQIGYWDREVGAIVVPAPGSDFRTDLTSVPTLFTWLVPKTGLHLPASLIHDGLVHEPGKDRTYLAESEIDRVTADRILRDAMRDAGTSGVRRWLVWTAVTIWAMVGPGPARTGRSVAAVAVTAGVVLVLGAAATADLLDCREWLFWMADRSFVAEVSLGLVGAVTVSGLLSLLWGAGRRRAGWVAGVALALLVHVTVALGIVSAVFTAVDRAVEHRFGAAAAWAAGAGLAGAGVLAFVDWACRPGFL